MAAVQEAHKTLLALWPVLEDHLGRSVFVAGNQFTMADIPVGCMAYR